MVRLFSHWFPSNTVLQVVFDAFFLVCCVLLAALWLHPGGVAQLEPVLPPALLFAVIMAGLNTALGLYQRSACRTVVQTTARVLLSLMLSIPVAYAVFRLLPWVELRQNTLNVIVLGALGALVGLRGFATHRGASPMFVRRVLVFGTGNEALAVENSMKLFGPGMRVIGFFPSPNHDGDSQVPPERIMRSDMSLLDAAFKHGVDDLIVAVRERRGGVLPLKELLECKLRGVRVLDLSSFYERALGQVRLESLHASWLIFGEGFRQGLVRTLVKRCFDIVMSSLLLIVTAPIMLITAMAISLESGFPVLYRQERVGQAGRLFRVIKFRSMRTDAEVDGRPRWAVKNDSPHHEGRPLHSQIAHRRIAPAHQCHQGRHESGRSASRASALCRPARARNPVLRSPPQREARRHRLGPGALSLRRPPSMTPWRNCNTISTTSRITRCFSTSSCCSKPSASF